MERGLLISILALILIFQSLISLVNTEKRSKHENRLVQFNLKNVQVLLQPWIELTVSNRTFKDKSTVQVLYKGVQQTSTQDILALYIVDEYYSIIDQTPNIRDIEKIVSKAPTKYKFLYQQDPYIKLSQGNITNQLKTGAEKQSENYIDTGAGTKVFKMINHRADMMFAIIRGGFENPIIIAISQLLQDIDKNQPLQAHLALTGDPTEMVVQWTSYISASPKVLLYENKVSSRSQDKLFVEQFSAESSTYVEQSLCGEPATTDGFHNPGLFHKAIMKGLKPDVSYCYKYGDEDQLSDSCHDFIVPPKATNGQSVSILLAADMGQAMDDYSNEENSQKASLSTTKNLYQDLISKPNFMYVQPSHIFFDILQKYVSQIFGYKSQSQLPSGKQTRIQLGDRMNYDTLWCQVLKQYFSSYDQHQTQLENTLLLQKLFIALKISLQKLQYPEAFKNSLQKTWERCLGSQPFSLYIQYGDLSYAMGYVSQWNRYFQQIELITQKIPMMVTLGNHEMDYPGSGDRFNLTTVTDSGGECGIPTLKRFHFPRGTPWYSFNHGPIHFLHYSTEHDFSYNSEQWNFMDKDLKSVDRQKTPWVIVGGHRPFYISSTNYDQPDGDQAVAYELRKELEQLFYEQKVDLTFHGHHHSYQRTCPVYKERCQGFTNKGVPKAPIHIVIGNGGYGLCYNIQSPQPKHFEMVELTWGYSRLYANMNELKYQSIANEQKNIIDEVYLHRS